MIAETAVFHVLELPKNSVKPGFFEHIAMHKKEAFRGTVLHIHAEGKNRINGPKSMKISRLGVPGPWYFWKTRG